MKKFIVVGLVMAACAVLAISGCEEEENANLSVLNRMGFTITHFSLNEFRGGENLLPEGTVLEDNALEPFPIPDGIRPGEYTWHVEYAEGMMTDGEDGPAAVELYPGPNHLMLSRF